MFKFEVKFATLNHRDPYLENSNLKFAMLCASKAMLPPLTCSGVGEGLGEKGATLRKQNPFLSQSKEKGEHQRELFY